MTGLKNLGQGNDVGMDILAGFTHMIAAHGFAEVISAGISFTFGDFKTALGSHPIFT